MDDSSFCLDQTGLRSHQSARYRFDPLGFFFQIGQKSEEMDIFLLDNQADRWLCLVLKDSSAHQQLSLPQSGRYFGGSVEMNGQNVASSLLLLDLSPTEMIPYAQHPVCMGAIQGGFQQLPSWL